jgi:LuxR family maltose regulon positive regulatory protein
MVAAVPARAVHDSMHEPAPLTSRLLNTKLTPPHARAGMLPRTELVERVLFESAHASVVVVEAPAGWGKSTLLGRCREASGIAERYAWFSIETSEDDPILFWSYLIEALDRVEPGIGNEAAALLRAPGTSLLEHVVPTLLNTLDAVSGPMVLVLDDYHVVADPRIHEATSFFIEHLPTHCRVVIAGRAVPDLPLARLRTQGRLYEIGIEELRLDPVEARQLLEQETATPLDTESAAELQARTEGWAAGLHLAALSARGRGDVRALVTDFHGDHRLLADYLVSEVLDGLQPEIRSFLFETAILDRLSAPLCDAVRSRHGSQEHLDEIERRQLFLLPLDNRRHWYRYHHLFVEFLRREVERSDPNRSAQLHARAARWFRDHGSTDEALHHLFAAGDPAEAGKILADEYMDYIVDGRTESALRWFENIPYATMRSSNVLCLARALCLLQCGRLSDAERWLEVAEQAPPTSARRLAGFFPSFESALNLIRASVHYHSGNVGETMRWSRRAHALEPVCEGDVFLTTTLPANAAYREGDLGEALDGYERDRVWAASVGYSLIHLHAASSIAVIHVRNGELPLARERLRECESVYERSNFREHVARAPAELAAGLLAEAEGEDTRAIERLRFASDLALRGPDRLVAIEILQELATIERRNGFDTDASRHERTADYLLGTCHDPGRILRERGPSRRAGGRAPRGRPAGLTERQIAVLRLVAQGLRNAEIARALEVSERTVHAHLRALYGRIGVRNRAAAVRFAVDHDLL